MADETGDATGEEVYGDEPAADGAEWVGPEGVSLEYLHAVFEAVGFTAAIDPATRTIRIQDEIVARVFLSDDNERLTANAFYTIRPTAARDKRLDLANRINQTSVMVRAWIDGDGDLGFGYTFFLVGGVTPTALAYTIRTFIDSVKFAVETDDTAGIIS